MGTGIIYGGMNTDYAKDGCFLTRDEVSAILLVCKNYKLHFSRKCAERPFENVISIVSKIPWHIPKIINTLHRDHIFELLKLSLESLKTHLSKEYINISPTLMNRLIRSGICCPGFTDKQKNMILNFSDHNCPKDIELFVYKAEKCLDKKEEIINQTFSADSLSSAYPSPPNSIKSISSTNSSEKIKTKQGQNEDKDSIISTLTSKTKITNASLPSYTSTNKLLRTDIPPIVHTKPLPDQNNISNEEKLNQEIYNNNFTNFETNRKLLNFENFELVNNNNNNNNNNNININNNNNNNEQDNLKNSNSSPIELNLMESNVEEKVLIDNINNALLNDNYNNEVSIKQNLEAKNSNELTNYSLNIPNPPHPFNQKIPPPSQNNFIYSTPPPPPISNYAPFTTSYPTPSSILFYDKKTSITSFPPSVPATPAQSIIPIKNLIPPPLLSFPIIPDNNNNNNNTINGVYLPPFDPIINTNFLIPNSNNIISPIEKENDMPNFTPFITSEGLINKNLQIRQNQNLNYPDKYVKDESSTPDSIIPMNAKETEFSSNNLATSNIITETIPSTQATTPTKILNEILTLSNTDTKNSNSNNSTTTTLKRNDTTSNKLKEGQYLTTTMVNSNSNINAIKTLQTIIQDLSNKCMKYDEQLKEALEHNKQLENKIIELEKNNNFNEHENKINEDVKEQEVVEDDIKELTSTPLSSISSVSQ